MNVRDYETGSQTHCHAINIPGILVHPFYRCNNWTKLLDNIMKGMCIQQGMSSIKSPQLSLYKIL